MEHTTPPDAADTEAAEAAAARDDERERERTRHLNSGFGMAVLHGLQYKPHIYGGTVPVETWAKRRQRNKAARAARRRTRLAARR